MTRKHCIPTVPGIILGLMLLVSSVSHADIIHSNLVNVGGSTRGKLMLGTDGKFYGSTVSGGSNSGGFVYTVTPDGQLTTLKSFAGDGYGSIGGLSGTGPFYGTTAFATNNSGTVWSITTNGTFTSILKFYGTNGASPEAPPLLRNGILWGGTGKGGAYDNGVIYAISISNNVMFWKHSLNSVTNGDYVRARPTEGKNGFLYVPCRSGGLYGGGTILRIDPINLTVTNFHNFTNGIDGATPETTLTLAKDENLYGTTRAGNTYNEGTVYRLDTNDVVTTLFSFHEDEGAVAPQELELGPIGDLALYGTFGYGNTNDPAEVYRLTLDGDMVEFLSIDNGGSAQRYANALTLGSDNCFYATMRYGPLYFFRISAPLQTSITEIMSTSCESNRVSWNSVAGQDYMVKASSTAGGPLTNLATITATNAISYYWDPWVTNGIRFYLVTTVTNGLGADYWANIQKGFLKAHESYNLVHCINSEVTNSPSTNTFTGPPPLP